MRYIDVFNGDADGICALRQLRLAEPREAELVTGVKRDVQLLKKIAGATAACITVLDISVDQNREELIQLLATCQVRYIDHHFAGVIPESERLETHIDPDADICTSLIVDRLLGGRFRSWAVAGAFGDNLHEPARAAAAAAGLSEAETAMLRELGELMNYNGYGKTVADLHIAPDALYRSLAPYEEPLAFFRDAETLGRLRAGYARDMAEAQDVPPRLLPGVGLIFLMPSAPWTRRVAGVFSNTKAREQPDLAHAFLADNGDGTHLVSVRAPLSRKSGADVLCRRFATGGGRAAAAGINELPHHQLADFIRAFEETFSP